jgi:hypothetical protein
MGRSPADYQHASHIGRSLATCKSFLLVAAQPTTLGANAGAEMVIDLRRVEP